MCRLRVKSWRSHVNLLTADYKMIYGIARYSQNLVLETVSTNSNLYSLVIRCSYIGSLVTGPGTLLKIVGYYSELHFYFAFDSR